MRDTNHLPVSPFEGTNPPEDHKSASGWATTFAVSLAMLAWLGPTRAMVPWALLPWSLAFLALWALFRSEVRWLERGSVLLGGALVLRLLFLATHQDLSDDLYRYVWDGWIQHQGINPYRWAPDDPALAALHGDLLFQAMNSPGWISVYPPLSQLVFQVGGWLHDRVGWPLSGWGIRAVFTTLEFGGILALYSALRITGASPKALMLYAWNPLVLLAVAGSGHSEGGLVLGMGLFLLGLARGSAKVGWLGWVLAVLAKGIPLLLGPLLLRALTRRMGTRTALIGMIPAALVGILLVGFFLRPRDLPGIFSSVRLYTDLFAFNGGLHPLLRTLGWSLFGVDTGPFLARSFALVSLGVALIVAWAWPLRDRAGVRGMASAGLIIISVYLVLTPTVHPWYLLWGLPLVVLASPILQAPWLWLSWAALPTYLFYLGFPAAPLAVLFWGGALLILVATLHTHREQVLAPLREVAGQRKARWIRPWVRGTRTLDVGGGEGDVLHALHQSNPEVIERHSSVGWVVDPEAGRPGQIRALGEALPFADQGVDSVILSFVLHHAQDPEQVLTEALRVSRQRVVILESVPRSPLERTLLEGVDRWVNAHRGKGSMGSPQAPLAMHPAAFWIAMAQNLEATVVHAGCPGGVHPVLLLVLEPTASASPAVDRQPTPVEDAS